MPVWLLFIYTSEHTYQDVNNELLCADNPGKYHIYEGLSQLTNISRYDLPDPDTYRYTDILYILVP